MRHAVGGLNYHVVNIYLPFLCYPHNKRLKTVLCPTLQINNIFMPNNYLGTVIYQWFM